MASFELETPVLVQNQLYFFFFFIVLNYNITNLVLPLDQGNQFQYLP